MTSREIVYGVADGESDAMTELYDQLVKYFRGYFIREDPARAEDLLHMAYIEIVESLRRRHMETPEALPGLMRTIVVRTILEQRIKQYRAPQTISFDGDDETLILLYRDNSQWPEKAAIREQYLSIVRSAMSELTPQYRELVERFYLQDESKEQIRQSTLLSEKQFALRKSNAKSRLTRIVRERLALAA